MKPIQKAVALLAIPALLTGCGTIRGFVQRKALDFAAPGMPEVQKKFAIEYMNKGPEALKSVPPEIIASFLDSGALEGFGISADMASSFKTMIAPQATSGTTQTLSPSPALSVKSTAVRTESDAALHKSLESLSLVYASQNKVYEQNIATGSVTDVTRGLESYAVSDARKFPGVDGVFFISNGNLYRAVDANNQRTVSLISENVRANEYAVRGDAVIFRRGNTIKRAHVNGSQTKEVMRGIDDAVSELKVSPNGSKAIVKLTPKQKQGPSSLFNETRYVVIDLQKEHTYDAIKGHLENVFWGDDTSLLFVKNGELFKAPLAAPSSDCFCIKPTPAEQLTADDARVDFAQGTGQGILFRSTKSGTPELYLLRDGTTAKIETMFDTLDAYLTGTASVPVATSGNSSAMPTDILTKYASNQNAIPTFKLALSKPKIRRAFEEYLQKGSIAPDVKEQLNNPTKNSELEQMVESPKYKPTLMAIIAADNDLIVRKFLENPKAFSQ